MRDSFVGTRNGFGACPHGEPTGDETPLYLDADEGDDRIPCQTCDSLSHGGECVACRIDRLLGRLPARILPMPRPAPLRRAA
ncbi:MAG TPA: hypothetical protein VGB53_12825 [Rubricoccaceae bacterium]